MQRFCGAGFRTLIAKDAFRSVFPFAGFFVDLYIHRADPQTFSAVYALTFVAVNAQQ